MTAQQFLNHYNNLESLLFAFAMKLTRNENNAQDLMQETVCKAYKNRGRFRVGTNFKAWITTIMHNNYINDYRKRKTRNKVEAPIEALAYSLESTTIKGSAASLIMMKELTVMVNSLTPGLHKAFTMFHEGYQYDEIAATLKVPIGTVKSRIFFARKKLKEMVQSRYNVNKMLRA